MSELKQPMFKKVTFIGSNVDGRPLAVVKRGEVTEINMEGWTCYSPAEHAALMERLSRAEANADAKDALLLRLRYYVDSKSQEYGYGFYRPGNPHDFTPDADQCSDDEIAAHKAACEAYDKGEYTHDHSGCIREGGMHILHAPWGIGSYIFRDPEVQELLDQIDAVRPSTPTTDAPQAKGSEVSK